MAATVTKRDEWQAGGNYKGYLLSIALDNSYPTGGYALDFAGNERIEELWVTGGSGAANAYDYEFDPAAQKLQGFRTDQIDDPQEEIPAATDLSAITALRAVAIGQ